MDNIVELIREHIEKGDLSGDTAFVSLIAPTLQTLFEKVLVKRRRRFLRRVKLLLARRRMLELTALCVCLDQAKPKAKVCSRSAWVLPRPQSWFDGVLLNSYEENIWMETFNISKRTFQHICGLFGSEIARQDTCMRESIPVEKRVAVALYRLATGTPYYKTGEKFGIGRCTALKIKDEFCKVLVNKAKDFIKFPITESDTTEAIKAFEEKCHIPQVVGAMDAVRFKIRAPSLVTHKMKYYNENLRCHSMTLQAVVDSKGRFINVSSGYPGGITYAEALKLSDLYRNVNQGLILQAPSKSIEGVDVSPIIVSDTPYKLRHWCICPFPVNTFLTPSQEHFNEEVEVAVKTARDALTMLRGRWRSLAGNCLEEHVEKIPETLLLCCVLHNICVDQDDATVIEPRHTEFESLLYCEDAVEDIEETITPLANCHAVADDIREALCAHVDLIQIRY